MASADLRVDVLPCHRAVLGRQGYRLNKKNIATAHAAVKPRDGGNAVKRPNRTWKPYPCLLTRREIQTIVAAQLG